MKTPNFTFHGNREKFGTWKQTVQPGGPFTLIRDGSGSALQFSLNTYTGAQPLDLPAEKLIGMAMQCCKRIRDPKQSSTESGDCEFGRFGTALVTGGDPAHVQAWVLWSGGNQIILITHVATSKPDALEVREACQFALSTTLAN